MGQERREYFRIDDTAAVEYVAVAEPDCHDRQADDFFTATQNFELLAQLQGIDQEASKLLLGLRDTQRELAGYLRLLNKKIDAVAAAVLHLGADAQQHPQKISLSAGGMSFGTQEKFASGDLLALRFRLVRESLFVCCFGRVVYCGENENGHGSATVAVEFENLGESSQTLLARHIMRCQQAMQRHRLKRSAKQSSS